eukprot:m51a1_g6061 hypothetical protein (279) ;mRNA; f:248299-249399
MYDQSRLEKTLHRACVAGNTAYVISHLSAPERVAAVPPNAAMPNYDTLLAEAIRHQHLDIAKALLAADNEVMVRELLAAGASPNAAGEDHDQLPLLAAAKWGSTRTIEMLLEAGADPRAKGARAEHSALAIAVKWSSFDAVELLVRHGADMNPEVNRFFEYETPLFCACERGLAFAELLLNSGAQLPDDCRRVMDTVQYRHGRDSKQEMVPMMTLLFQHGANAHSEFKDQVKRMKAVRRGMATAFALGHHRRRGARSPVGMMDRATMCSVFQLLFWRR